MQLDESQLIDDPQSTPPEAATENAETLPASEPGDIPAPSKPPVDESESVRLLSQSLEKHGISLSAKKITLLARYSRLLWDWNEKINLTRHTDYDKFVGRDVVDSLALGEFLEQGERVLDVGTGGGVPGVILAILRPDLKVELCDSTGKKATAVGNMLESLRLEVPVWHSKAEDLFPGRRYSTLLVRAVSKMPKLLEMFAPHWQCFERLLLLKGPNWVAERGESRHYGLLKNLALRVLKTYAVPDTTTSAAEETQGGSVVLQICQKNKLDRLSQEILASLQEKPKTKPGANVRNDSRKR